VNEKGFITLTPGRNQFFEENKPTAQIPVGRNHFPEEINTRQLQ